MDGLGPAADSPSVGDRLTDCSTPVQRVLSKAGSQTGARCNGYWWHVNKTGFPISAHTWEKLWDHILDVHPDGEVLARDIREKPQSKVAIPIPPSLNGASHVGKSLQAVQSYMNLLQYNHTGTQFFDIRKNGPLFRRVMFA